MKKNAPSEASDEAPAESPRTLAIDIGGTGIKSIVLDSRGKPITERLRMPTPSKATPRNVIDVVSKLAAQQGEFERVSVGFPGVVKDGLVYTAANLGKGWSGFDLGKALRKTLKRPVCVANDADVQGLGSVSGRGLELVITLGTGFGSVLFADGRLIHLEVAHHPFHQGRTYEEELGKRALQAKGRKKWNKRLAEALDDLKRTFNYDRLYIGGGNTKFINIKLPSEVKIVSNEAGLLGGIKLWEEAPGSALSPGKVAVAARRSAQPRPRAKPAALPASDESGPDGTAAPQ
jgi:polyphosphate glucokinase